MFRRDALRTIGGLLTIPCVPRVSSNLNFDRGLEWTNKPLWVEGLWLRRNEPWPRRVTTHRVVLMRTKYLCVCCWNGIIPITDPELLECLWYGPIPE